MNRILSALTAVIQQHPILSAIPVDEDLECLRLIHLLKIDLRRVAERVIREWQYNGKGREEVLDELLEA